LTESVVSKSLCKNFLFDQTDGLVFQSNNKDHKTFGGIPAISLLMLLHLELGQTSNNKKAKLVKNRIVFTVFMGEVVGDNQSFLQ